MPVEIVPKPKAKPKKIVKILLYLSLIILILTISVYFGLDFFEKKKSEELEGLKKDLEAKETKELKDLREKLLKYEEKIDEFSVLIDSYRYSTKFFKFLEDNTHSKVMWSNIDINLLGFKVVLSGQADSLTTLIQQIFIFEALPKIESLEMSGLSLLGEGGVSFSFDLSLSPDLFLFKY